MSSHLSHKSASHLASLSEFCQKICQSKIASQLVLVFEISVFSICNIVAISECGICKVVFGLILVSVVFGLIGIQNSEFGIWNEHLLCHLSQRSVVGHMSVSFGIWCGVYGI